MNRRTVAHRRARSLQRAAARSLRSWRGTLWQPWLMLTALAFILAPLTLWSFYLMRVQADVRAASKNSDMGMDNRFALRASPNSLQNGMALPTNLQQAASANLLQQAASSNSQQLNPPSRVEFNVNIEDELANWLDSDMHRCGYIENLLSNGKAVGNPLPQSGTARRGGPFYLKQPVLHTVDPVSGAEVMVLRYNIYNRDPSWTQHTDKFRNTVKVLLKNRREASSVFPKLYGFCNDINGYHHIVVEYVPYEVYDLPTPTTPEQCFLRADRILGLFSTVDEKFHLTFADIKPGQWMFRADESAVLQDIDDIVPPGTPMIYSDQAKWHMDRITGELHMKWQDLDKIWKLKMFPRNELSARYMVINAPFVLDNLGFHWHKCGMDTEFMQCKSDWKTWALELEDDAWPSPLQLHEAFRSCYESGTFLRMPRPPAPWRDLTPGDSNTYVMPSSCSREYDKPSKSSRLQMCEHSCCRGKGSNPCYYTAPMAECQKAT